MRAFLAIELPDRMRQALGEMQRKLASGGDGWRWARPEGIHLTLRFLGEMAEADVARALSPWRAAVSTVPAFTIRIGDIGAFPSQRRPRVLWAGVIEDPPAGRLSALAESLDAASASVGLGRSDRAFTPHLTLARAVGAGARMPSAREPILGGSALVSEVVLFRSELRPAGAVHTPLERLPLLRPASSP